MAMQFLFVSNIKDDEPSFLGAIDMRFLYLIMVSRFLFSVIATSSLFRLYSRLWSGWNVHDKCARKDYRVKKAMKRR